MKSGKEKRLSKQEIQERQERDARISQCKEREIQTQRTQSSSIAHNIAVVAAKVPSRSEVESGKYSRGSLSSFRRNKERAARETPLSQVLSVFRHKVYEVGRKDGFLYQYTGTKKVTWISYNVSNTTALTAPEGENLVYLYHGTSVGALGRILTEGVAKSSGGLLGPGTYLGGEDKATGYLRTVVGDTNGFEGAMVKCAVVLGTVRDVTDSWKKVPPPYDTLHGVPGVTEVWARARPVFQTNVPITPKNFLQHEEWCVQDPSRIQIVSFKVAIAR